MAMLHNQRVYKWSIMIYPLNMVIFHSKLVVSPCLTPGLRLKPRLAQVELLNVSQRHAANFAWLELGRHCYVAVKTCDKTWQKHRRSLSLSESISIHTDLSGIYPNASGYPIFSRFFRISPDLSYLKSMDQCQCWTTTTAPSDATRKATKWPKGPCPSPRFHTFRVKNGSNSCGIYIYIYRLDDFGEF